MACTHLLGPIMEAVLAQSEAALTPPGTQECPVEHDVPERVHLQPGAQVAWDGGCGQLWVRLLPIRPNIVRGVRPPKCGPHEWSVSLAVGVLRCVQALGDDGTLPAVEQMNGEALQMVDDMETLQHALQNLMLPWQAKEVTLDQWTPLGPQGGLAGGEWTLSFKVPNCG